MVTNEIFGQDRQDQEREKGELYSFKYDCSQIELLLKPLPQLLSNQSGHGRPDQGLCTKSLPGLRIHYSSCNRHNM